MNNFNSERMEWESAKLAAMLANRAARGRAIQNLLQFVRDHGCVGVSIDFENVPATAQPELKTFMYELYAQFHPLGLEVSQSVPLDDPAFDYRGLATATDYLILMAYDEHWSSSQAGPIASQGWYTAALRRRFAELPPQKYVIALGNYGYDWKAKGKAATEISVQEAFRTAQESEGTLSSIRSRATPPLPTTTRTMRYITSGSSMVSRSSINWWQGNSTGRAALPYGV